MRVHPVARAVRRAIERHSLLKPGQNLVVGVSGGPDSLCLLHVLRHSLASFELSLHVAHLNHSIRGQDAQADADFVRQVAEEWQLPVAVEQADVPDFANRHKMALEEAARSVRYSFLSRVAFRTGATRIAVGHNADDQAETVLMHWLRGSGLSGLRGMLPATPLHEYRLVGNHSGLAEEMDRPMQVGAGLEQPLTLIRPLLEVPRDEIEDYCRQYDLDVRQDRSNQDVTYFRNRLRYELLPFLESYNPNIREVVRRSADLMAADYDLLRQQLDQAWLQTVNSQLEQAVVFDLALWRELHPSLKRATLREAVRRLRRALRNINFEHVEKAVALASNGDTGAQATLPQGLMLTVGYDTILVADEEYQSLPDLPLLSGEEVFSVNLPGRTRLQSGSWVLTTEILPRAAVLDKLSPEGLPAILDRRSWQAYLDADAIGSGPVLRSRRVGDRFCPLGMNGRSKRVNELMINEKIPAAWRDHIPLLVSSEGEILWVCGWRPDHRARVSKSTQQLVWLRFEREGEAG